jgi:hypothetical protein
MQKNLATVSCLKPDPGAEFDQKNARRTHALALDQEILLFF